MSGSDAMDGPVNGETIAVETLASCCGGETHSPATCPCLCHRPAANAPEQAREDSDHVLSVDLRSGALVIEFSEQGDPLPTFDVGKLSPTRLLAAATYLHSFGEILQKEQLAFHINKMREEARAGVVGAAPGAHRAATRRLQRIR